MKLSMTSKKTAVSLSYLSTVIQALATMILTRFYLEQLGKETYGLYQMIYAVAQYILILDLGISTVMIRYISEFEAERDRARAENFAFHFALLVAIIAVAVAGIGVIVNSCLENIYPTLTATEYELSHQLFQVMIVQLVFTVISHYFRGLCDAYEQFVFTRTVSVLQIVANFVLVFIFVKCGMGLMGIVAANTIVIVANVLVTALYAVIAVKFRIRFHHWEPSFFRPVFLLMLAMLLQAIVGYVNSSVDKTILGIMTTKTDVTIYAIAATIITMFNTLPTTVSSVFQPSATRLVVDKADGERLTDFVIRPGRIQFMLIGGFLAGFTVFGKDFIECWAGKDMYPAWLYVMVIMIPNAVPLMQNTCLSILNALDRRIYRSIILVGITALNILLTILLIPMVGPFGAPLATGISYVLGHCILMNIYYKKNIGLNIKRMFKDILHRTWLCVFAALVLTLPLVLWRCNESWLVLIAKAVIFCTVYAVALWLFGMNKSEKKMMQAVARRLPFLSHMNRSVS